MKPIFEIERKMLEKELNVIIPKYCWKDTSNNIYLNCSDKEPIIKFKCIDGLELKLIKHPNTATFNIKNIFIIDNETYVVNNIIYKVENWENEYVKYSEQINNKYNKSKEYLTNYLIKHPKSEVRISVSGGKDSDLNYYISKKVLNKLNKNFNVDMFNTTNESGKTFLHAKKDYENLTIHTPDIGWYDWLYNVKNNFIPSVMNRTCCQKFKEDRLYDILDKKQEYVILLGLRKNESINRAIYDWDINESWIKANPTKPLMVEPNWHRFAPIIEWEDYEVWLFLLHNNIPFNKMYELGFNRTGCLICPYARSYSDFLCRKYYPLLWSKWEKALEKNYETYNVEKRLKWSIEDWKKGKWKAQTSKEYDIIKLKPTKERIEEVAKIKNISIKIAEKYFNRYCSCGKKLNPDEIGFNLKSFGRYENLPIELELKREMLCKKCMCKKMNIKKKEYSSMIIRYREQNCELF